MRDEINKLQIQLSIIIVGISTNDTSLGMRVKTGLETVSIKDLESIYYASSQREMNEVIGKLNSGCINSLCRGIPVSLKINKGIFIENSKNEMKSFLSNDNETIITVLHNTAHSRSSSEGPMLLLDGLKIVPQDITPDYGDVSLVVDSIIPKPSQIKIGNGIGSIDSQINTLSQFIDSAESLFESLKNKDNIEHSVDEIGTVSLRPGIRLQMIKKIKQSQNEFQQERNKLKMLKVSVENDSAKQAEYLTGFNKKYSAKAIIKADTINLTY